MDITRTRNTKTMGRTPAEEAAFMSELMHGLDDDFWTAVPSPAVSPVKPVKKHSHSAPFSLSASASAFASATICTPAKVQVKAKTKTKEMDAEMDMKAFLQDSEYWDLGDDVPSPIKPKVKVKNVVQLPSAPARVPQPQPVFAAPPPLKTAPAPKTNMPVYVSDPCTRCEVLSITQECVDNRWQKRIQAKVPKTDEEVEVVLCDDWYQTDIRLDDIFNVLGTFTPSPSAQNTKRTIHITSQTNLLILHPDILITATALSTASRCMRKPLLTALVRQSTDITPALVYGNILHEVMQKCFLENRWEEMFIRACVDEAVRGSLGELVKLGLGEEVARNEVREKARGFGIFAGRYLGGKPKDTAILNNTRSTAHDAPSLLAITQLLDIEEDIWSPTYGLKGKIDATVRGIIDDPLPASTSSSSSAFHNHNHSASRSNGLYNSGLTAHTNRTNPVQAHHQTLTQTCIPSQAFTSTSTRRVTRTQTQAPTRTRTQTYTPLPLELKTGRVQTGMDHRAQTMLYTLLISERYGVDVRDGLLFYSQCRVVEGSGSGASSGSGTSNSGTGSWNAGARTGSHGAKGAATQREGKGGEDKLIGENIVRVPRGRNEVRGLIGVRNELAGYMWRRIRKRKGMKEGMKDVESEKEKEKERTDLAGVKMEMETESAECEMEDIEDAVSHGQLGSRKYDKGEENSEDEEKDAEKDNEEEHFLPAPIDDERACKRCYAIETCMLFRKTHPHYLPPSPTAIASSSSSPTTQSLTKPKREIPLPPALIPLFTMHTAHLTPFHTEFFKKWEKLLALEERDLVRFRRELWVLGAAEREGRGRCLGGMRVVDVGGEKKGAETKNGEGWGKEGKIHRFVYTFEKDPSYVNAPSQSQNGSSQTASQTASSQNASQTQTQLLNTHLSKGDPITISCMSPREVLALARGYILDIQVVSPERGMGKVVVGVDHSLDAWLFGGVGGGAGGLSAPGTLRHAKEEHRADETPIFRIDKDELFGGMARVRENLASLFYASSIPGGSGHAGKKGKGDRKRLELVVDLRAPLFSDEGDMSVDRDADADAKASASATTTHLNTSQSRAISKVLRAQDYALILGMPGTGKTSVIAELVRELVGRRGKTVLVSSYTHSAVDSILRKVGEGMEGGGKKEGGEFGILRLGNVEKIHPEVRKYSPAAMRTATTVEQLEKQFMDAPVVATTCLSLDHPLFSRRRFDYCIVDEASQITLPTCLGPLRFADVFVLVGDHYQLPPLVKNPEARLGGLDISLFRRLSEAHPHAIVDLTEQYRMNEEIMTLSNTLIYEGRLKCGSEEVRERGLVLGGEGKRFLGRVHAGVNHKEEENGGCAGGEGCWLERLCDERTKAIFVDTDALPARDSRVGDLVQNITEAELVRQFVETLVRSGVQEERIGVISLYRQQVKVLGEMLGDRVKGEEGGKGGVEIMTADKSQGRDKDCVVVSLVRSNEEGNIGDLVKDWRRINVSFTRARCKLVIFGSRKTLEREPLLGKFFELMQGKGWILSLKPGANTAHRVGVFEGCAGAGAGAGHKGGAKRRGCGCAVGADAGGCDAEHENDETSQKENTMLVPTVIVEDEKESRPMKKVKLESGFSPTFASAAAGVLRGRPILRDLVGNEI